MRGVMRRKIGVKEKADFTFRLSVQYKIRKHNTFQ